MRLSESDSELMENEAVGIKRGDGKMDLKIDNSVIREMVDELMQEDLEDEVDRPSPVEDATQVNEEIPEEVVEKKEKTNPGPKNPKMRKKNQFEARNSDIPKLLAEVSFQGKKRSCPIDFLFKYC